MATFAPRSGLSEAARITFTAALLLFIATIVIGILNGIDVWEPNHDTLISHVHAGTLGWITLGVSGIAFLMFSRDRQVSAVEASKARTLAWAMVGAVTL
jgi:membrane-bound ClpP family serine protease